MKLEALRYFHVTAQCGSIRKAADRLHIAPSAISRQIAVLERELKLRLFERTSNGVSTTEAGRLLAQHTHSIFRDIGRAQSAIDNLRGLRTGEVTVYAIEGLVGGFLPPFLSEFHKKFPGISVNLVLAPTDRIIEALVQDEADIGFTFNARARREIVVAARYVEPVSCIVSPRHPLAQQKSVTLKMLQQYPLALPDHAFGLRQLIEEVAKRHRLTLRNFVTTNSLELTKTLAATGTAIAFMPAFTVSAEIARGSLKCVPITDRAFQTARSEVCIHRNRGISDAATAFLKALVEEVKALERRP